MISLSGFRIHLSVPALSTQLCFCLPLGCLRGRQRKAEQDHVTLCMFQVTFCSRVEVSMWGSHGGGETIHFREDGWPHGTIQNAGGA